MTQQEQQQHDYNQQLGHAHALRNAQEAAARQQQQTITPVNQTYTFQPAPVVKSYWEEQQERERRGY